MSEIELQVNGDVVCLKDQTDSTLLGARRDRLGRNQNYLPRSWAKRVTPDFV